MFQAVSIRPEQPQDAQAVRDVVQQAYAGISYSDHREHFMVDRLRASAAYVPQLSLLAEVDASIVGHVMLTKVTVVDGASEVHGLCLAPLSVVPALQGKRVGDQLVREAHRRAKDLGFPFIILIGSPRYYFRFGYQPLDAYPVVLPFQVPASNRMVMPLSPTALDDVRGNVEFAPEWLEH